MVEGDFVRLDEPEKTGMQAFVLYDASVSFYLTLRNRERAQKGEGSHRLV